MTVNKESYLQSSKDQGLVISVVTHLGREYIVRAIQAVHLKVQLNWSFLVQFRPSWLLKPKNVKSKTADVHTCQLFSFTLIVFLRCETLTSHCNATGSNTLSSFSSFLGETSSLSLLLEKNPTRWNNVI